YFNIKLIPPYKELNIKYYKDFPDRFIETLVSYDVIQSGIWNEYGARQLYEHWMMSDDAITEVASNQFVYSKSLALKLAGYEVSCKTNDRQVLINDSLVYTYWVWDNWTRDYRYRKGIEELYYHIYDLRSEEHTSE